MHRIDTTTKAVDLFGVGKHGFKDSNKTLGIAPTEIDASWFNDLQENIVRLLENAGISPSPGDYTQLTTAIQQLIKGEKVTFIVRAASTAAINLAAPGAAIDGVTMTAGDPFLEKDHGTPSSRGVYIWNGAATPATRAPELDSTAEFKAGVLINVTEGTSNGDSLWSLTTDGPIVVGTTALAFARKDAAQQASAGEITAETAVLKYISPDRLSASPRVAKAWVVFTTVTTTTITASFNVTSLTDNGVGDTTVNFTTALPSANYAVSGTSANASGAVACIGVSTTTAPTASALRVYTGHFAAGGATGVPGDYSRNSIVCTGG